MAITFKIKHVTNGLAVNVRYSDHQDVNLEFPTFVYQNGEKGNWVSFLREVSKQCGQSYNKFGLEEVSVDVRPGRKCEMADHVGWFLKDMYTEATQEQIEQITTYVQKVMIR